jgi:predicted RNA binding protein YcfA (HicA-like mRNA interferase family)
MVRFLKSRGFEVLRIRGSHHVVEHGTLHTVVPVHGSKTLRIGTLRGILRDVEMSPADFIRLWHEQTR